MTQEAANPGVVQGQLFAGLTADAANAVLAAAASRQVAPGATLFRQGDPPEHLFQVVSGLVKMTQISADGAQATLRMMGTGELIGCVAVFRQFPYPATALAVGSVTVLSWRSAQFFEFMSRYPAVTENVLRVVSQHAHELLQRVVEMSGKRVDQRIAGALLRLAGQVGTRIEGGVRIGFPVTRSDLAEMAGVTYFTISRTLSAWQRQGLVRNGRQRITILAPDRIAQIAEGRRPVSGLRDKAPAATRTPAR